MKKMILVGLLALGLLLLATFALAADTTTTATDTAKDGNTLRCCNHNWADSNNDGKCDTCGMAYEDIAKFNQGNGKCSGCTGCGGGHGHGGNH